MAEQPRVRQDLALLDVLDSLIAEVEQHVGRLSMTPPWEQQVPFLLQLPGLPTRLCDDHFSRRV
jgi:hypothetical protein